MDQRISKVAEALQKDREAFLAEWMADLGASGGRRDELMKESELRQQCAAFFDAMVAALSRGDLDTNATSWDATRNLLASVSRTRAQQGFSPRETATFVFSFKRPLFRRMKSSVASAEELADVSWEIGAILDGLGLYTTEVFVKSRETVIGRQQQELLELSTPVVQLWDGILALPMIGTLDSARTQVVMESLLQRIVETGSSIAILDITGVPTVDTLVAQHLLKTVAAARLMGAECIISGIRPQIAQTVVHLGVDLADVITKATLADAFRVALSRSRRSVTDSAS
jgi:rsbT co-antagonist protein RsbR